FSLKGVTPGRYRVGVTMPGGIGGMLGAFAGAAAMSGVDVGASSTWTLKSIMAGTRDVADLALDVQPNQDVTGLLATFTDRPTELSGVVRDRAGRPAPNFPILVFSTDRNFWTIASRRVQQSRPASDGKFKLTGLPAGEYYI